MTETKYVPLIPAPATDGGFSDSNVISLQEQLHEHDVTHVRTTKGKVWKIFQLLNKKSVPLNNGGDGPQRVNFGSVESFGIMATPPDKLVDEVRAFKEQGFDVEFRPAPGGGPADRPGTRLAAAIETVNAEKTNPVDATGTTFGEHLQNVIETGKVDEHWTPAPPLAEATDGGEEREAPATITPAGHQDRAHAILSASGAHRWINCTPSARLEEQLPDSTSDAAEQGTAAHELAEWKLREQVGEAELDTAPTSHWHDEEMEDHTDTYVDHVTAELHRTKENSPAAFLSIEERLDFSHLVPDGFGTGDAVIVGDGTMTIVDLKYGKGVEVSAVENPQMMLYALGALNTYGMIYQITQVRMVIYQPRRHNISVWETSVQDLLDWADQVVKPAAALAYAGDGELKAGEWCQFCRHAPQCTALAAQHFQVIPTEAPMTAAPTAPAPDTLTDEQIAQVVQHAGAIKKWLTSVANHALKTASNGHTYPGLKLVEGRANRKYKDEDAVAAKVTEAGHDPWKKRELIGLTDMTTLLGKKKFNELLGGLLVKPDGKPTLVPEDDKRPALSVATPDTVFNVIEETA